MDPRKKKYIAKLIKEIVQESIGGDSIHILSDRNAVIEQRDINGFPYNCLVLNLQQDLSEGDIDKLCTELKAFKEKLSKLNTPPQQA